MPEVFGSWQGWPEGGVTWKGVGILKSPNDLFLQAQIIWKTKPDIIVETGTWRGGSAYWYADLGVEVHTVDVAEVSGRRGHSSNTYYIGSSVDSDIVEAIHRACAAKKVMVVLDSKHTRSHVTAELDCYADLVSPGCYLIVEDTVLHPEVGEAVSEWLPGKPFTVDDSITATEHVGGYLFRK